MRCAAATMLAALLVACASSDVSDLPPECQGDLGHVSVPVVATTPADMERLAVALKVPPGRRLYGARIGDEAILVDSTLHGWKRDYVIRHERCHVLVGDWHDERPRRFGAG